MSTPGRGPTTCTPSASPDIALGANLKGVSRVSDPQLSLVDREFTNSVRLDAGTVQKSSSGRFDPVTMNRMTHSFTRSGHVPCERWSAGDHGGHKAESN